MERQTFHLFTRKRNHLATGSLKAERAGVSLSRLGLVFVVLASLACNLSGQPTGQSPSPTGSATGPTVTPLLGITPAGKAPAPANLSDIKAIARQVYDQVQAGQDLTPLLGGIFEALGVPVLSESADGRSGVAKLNAGKPAIFDAQLELIGHGYANGMAVNLDSFLADLGGACMAMALSAGLALADDPVHVVQPGEDLYRIGLHYGVDWRAIMAANGLVSTTIYTGQRLFIPGAAASGAQTPLPAAASASPAVPSASGSAYVIRPGDTLLRIAQRFHVTVSSLMALNGLADANRIYAGQTLVIPGAVGKWLAVSGHAQALPLDCESRSAVDWASFFGTRISEQEFFSRLPVSDDPDTGFVGSVHGRWGQIPPGPYGVYAGPVAALLRTYGVRAQPRQGLTWDSVRAELDAGRPVMVWVVGHVSSGAALSYTAASDGHTTTVAPYEHTVIVTGYSADAVTVVDGGAVYDRSPAAFTASWSALGNMAVLATP